jgi:hypothetical protein
MSNVQWWIGRLVLVSTFAGSLAPICATAQETGLTMPGVLAASDRALVYRLDVITGKLDPIKRDDLKAGHIYYHFSSRLNGWAWSFCQNDHSFWYAFGEGTTQIARLFDIRASREAIAKRLEEFPELAKQVDQYNQSVCLRLQSDGRWKIVGTGIISSIFNAETGERWQRFAKHEYIPVVHTDGNVWTVRNGVYYPSSSFFSER